jgi:hypothetical protein
MQFLWSTFIGGRVNGFLLPSIFFWITRQFAGTRPPQRARISPQTFVWLFPVTFGIVTALSRAGIGYLIDDASVRDSFSWGLGTAIGGSSVYYCLCGVGYPPNS